jgi:hypothetical protein
MWDLWWKKWHWGRFSRSTSVPLPILIHRLLNIHHHLSSKAGIKGLLVADVLSGLSLTPPQETKKSNDASSVWTIQCRMIVWLTNDGLERIWKEPVTIQSGQPVFRPSFEQSTSENKTKICSVYTPSCLVLRHRDTFIFTCCHLHSNGAAPETKCHYHVMGGKDRLGCRRS